MKLSDEFPPFCLEGQVRRGLFTCTDGHRTVPSCWVTCTSSTPLSWWNAPPLKGCCPCVLSYANCCATPCLPILLAGHLLLVTSAPQGWLLDEWGLAMVTPGPTQALSVTLTRTAGSWQVSALPWGFLGLGNIHVHHDLPRPAECACTRADCLGK